MAGSYDVIVLGLGGMGSATAYQLAKRGKRVLGLERHTPAHAAGSSHGHSRVIRQAYLEGPAYVPLLLRAYELWQQISLDSGQTDILMVTGGLMIGRPESRVVTGSITSAQAYNLPHEILDAHEIRRRFAPLTPSDDFVALYERQAGFVNPEAAILAHLAQATDHGAELHFEEPATSWQASPSGEGVTVTTASGTYHGSRLVVAAGPWTPEILADLGLPLVVHRQVMYWFNPIGGAEPFMPDRFPIYIWEIDNVWDGGKPASFYGFPAQDGPTGSVKAAFHTRFGNPACTPATIDRSVAAHEVQRMQQALAGRVPALTGPLVQAATCMYTVTPDEHFVVGQHPEHPQVTIASPCSGHGFKFVSVMGEILADLASDGTTGHEIALFAVDRFAQTHS